MDDHDTDIHELNGKTPEFRTELAKQLEDLVPEAIADGKVDVAKLKELLDTDAGDTSERFGLFWPGKKHAMRAAQDPTTATLKPAKNLSKNWDDTSNIFIEGDNLEVLKVLQKQYHNAIKMIYIDPPYNTGKDFVYPDNFKEGLQNYLEFSKQVDEGNKKISTNTETAGRYHSNWLNMMYPRLKLARNLLTDDGVIFISIDYNESFTLRQLCNEVFGEDKFVGEIYWESKTKSQNTETSFDKLQPKAEMILVYSRQPKKRFNLVVTGEKEYPLEDEQGKYREYRLEVMNAAGMRGRESMIYEVLGIMPPEGKQWKLGQDQVATYQNSGNLFTRDGKIYIKMRPENERSETTEPFWGFFDKSMGTAESAKKELTGLLGKHGFETVKPVNIIKRLAYHVTDKDSLVLDFFSGSGTTAHAVMQLNAEDGGNRKHIQVQLPEPTDEKSEAYKAGYRKISDIARERINRAGEKIITDYTDKLAERQKDGNAPLDTGYRTYQLADTNFRKWQSSATSDLGELQARLDLMRESANDDASETDLLVEVMLKMGLPLTARTTVRDVAGLSVHQVVADADDGGETADAQPVFYLNEHIKPDLAQLRAIVTELTPSKFVILDDAFQGDNELKTNLVQTCKSYEVELWTV